MQRTLSARPTAFLKFVLSPIWIAAMSYIVWRLWTDPSGLLNRDVSTGTPIVVWILLGLIGASLIILFAFVVPLKRVRMAETGLGISNYFREATVPFGAILTVRQNWLPTFRLITLKLRPDAGWGTRVIFIPAGSQRLTFWRQDYWHEDALVGELQRLAELSA